MLQLQTVEPNTFSLLKQLASLAVLKDFRLCGGTSLALQIGHRISVDLDFFADVPVDFMDDLLDTLNRTFEVEINYRNQKVLSCFIQNVKLDFVRYPYAWLTEPLFLEGITFCSIEDIGAMKLEAIKGRGRKRDFTDLYFLLRKFSLEHLFQFNLKKYKNNDKTLIMRSLSYFVDAEEDEDASTFEQISWHDVKATIQTELKEYLRKM